MRGEQRDSRTRVAFADERALLRAESRRVLEGQADIEVLGSLEGDLAALARELRREDPQVLVLDLGQPRRESAEAIAMLRELLPDTQIVVISSVRDAASAQPLLDAGAVALIAPESLARDLPRAVRAASLGERYLSRRVESLLRGGHRPRGGGDGLTPRETEVLSLIALGHTSAEIAGVLRVSPRTVETHRARVHKKLGLATRAELVRYALASGLLRG
ncbi:MAG TPA: response regulator transcription factor [Solirubrobacteraceae bacterium]|jgi:two-component system response regulator NreC